MNSLQESGNYGYLHKQGSNKPFWGCRPVPIFAISWKSEE